LRLNLSAGRAPAAADADAVADILDKVRRGAARAACVQLRRPPCPAPPLTPAPALPAPGAPQVHDWAAFDVFKLADASGGRPLQLVAGRLLNSLGVVARLGLPAPRLDSFLAAVEAAYGAQPYQNATHAADVTQALGAMMALDAWGGALTDWEAVTVVVAAAVHDLGHPGVNNDFHRRTGSAAAGRFAAAGSINERSHAELALSLLAAPEHDFLAGAHPADAAAARQLLGELVLSTDMARHGEVVATFAGALERCGGALGGWPPSERPSALRMLLHCADISNPARPLAACRVWGGRVAAEMFAQGDLERGLGLDVTPACDRACSSPPRAQAAFIRHVLRPSLQALAPLAPCFVAEVEPYVAASLEHWQREAGDPVGGECVGGEGPEGPTLREAGRPASSDVISYIAP
jgi:hypothetical protein